MSRPHKPRLGPGDLVAIQLPCGQCGLIWMIRVSDEHGFHFLVMDGFWPTRPTATDLRRARPSRSQGSMLLPGYDDVWKGWFKGRVPSHFHIVGRRTPSKQANAYIDNLSGTMIFGTAARLRTELNRSWRRKHDRAAFEAELAADQARREQAAARRRAAMTLPKMLREHIFESWNDHWPSHVVREARRIFRNATKELIALAPTATKRERANVLRRITSEFNELDDKEGCIETTEREEIVARIEELAGVVPIPVES